MILVGFGPILIAVVIWALNAAYRRHQRNLEATRRWISKEERVQALAPDIDRRQLRHFSGMGNHGDYPAGRHDDRTDSLSAIAMGMVYHPADLGTTHPQHNPSPSYDPGPSYSPSYDSGSSASSSDSGSSPSYDSGSSSGGDW